MAALGNLGLLALRNGGPETAEELLEESLLLANLVDDAWYVANICVSLAYVVMRLGDADRADTLLRGGIVLAADLGEAPLQAEALDGFAALAARTDDADRAVTLAGAASAIRERVAVPEQSAPSFRETYVRHLLTGGAPDVLQKALARGRGLEPTDAVSYALGSDVL